ncbi:SsgA family sporulation/cell division regulator [Streptomyces sp. NPDC031705]|uniref:SsgA family sporulation/cell division regulator n=1 Tax=Streptomyces sp. NPDC031705 TaxID=3155729 RepID=UPI0033F8FBCE
MPAVSAHAAVHAMDAGGRVALQAHLFYDLVDPYAVRVQFLDRGTALACWYFDRQMLAEGMHRRVGEGDVAFRPQRTADGHEVHVELRDHSAPGRAVVITMDAADLADFLDRTYALAPPGYEAVDLDGSLRDLLAW